MWSLYLSGEFVHMHRQTIRLGGVGVADPFALRTEIDYQACCLVFGEGAVANLATHSPQIEEGPILPGLGDRVSLE